MNTPKPITVKVAEFSTDTQDYIDRHEQPEPDYLEGEGPCEAMPDWQARGER